MYIVYLSISMYNYKTWQVNDAGEINQSELIKSMPEGFQDLMTAKFDEFYSVCNVESKILTLIVIRGF